MIRVVLDTNIVVSALISPLGNPVLILDAVQSGKLTPCFSRAIAAEYADVLRRPKFGFAKDEVEGLVDLLQSRGFEVNPKRMARVLPDPKDEPFLACALAANASYLITGNKRHFPAPSYGSTKVVSAREMIAVIHTDQSS
jgi:uncharacterized protein